MECGGQSKWCGLHLSSFGSLGGEERRGTERIFHSGFSGGPINGKALDLGCGLAGKLMALMDWIGSWSSKLEKCWEIA